MTLPRKIAILVAVSVLILTCVYLWGARRRSQYLQRGRVREPVVHTTARAVTEAPQPVMFFLLDRSASLAAGQTRTGNDPQNRQFEAMQLLLRLIHHFSSPDPDGFAPRVGIVTFGASPRWLEIGGQRIWRVRTSEALENALIELERALGGVGEADRRRGTFTDVNGALFETLAELEQIDRNAAPRVLLMTDGEHHPYPVHRWNYSSETADGLASFHAEVRRETLRNLDAIRSALPPPLLNALRRRLEALDYAEREPVEYLLELPTLDPQFAALLEEPSHRESFPYAVAAVRDVRAVQVARLDLARQEANRQLLETYLPRLAERAEIQVVGLSPRSREELEQGPETDPGRRMLDDLQRMVEAAGQPPPELRWCNDAGLAREFLSLFEQWLRLLREDRVLATGSTIEVGGHVAGLAVLAEPHSGAASLALLGPDGQEISPVTANGQRVLFLIRRPAPGAYRVQSSPPRAAGAVLALIQADPLFQVESVVDRVRVGSPPPQAQILAFTAASGNRVALHEMFQEVPERLTGELVGPDGRTLGQVLWRPRRDEVGRVLDWELDDGFWTSGAPRQPGRYVVHTRLDGLRYLDGVQGTPQPLEFAFEVEPAVLVTVHDAEGYRHAALDFPPRSLPFMPGDTP